MDKYRHVHEINRAGNMLDNVMYFNLRLERDLFDPALLEEICRQSADSAQLDGDGVLLARIDRAVEDRAAAGLPADRER